MVIPSSSIPWSVGGCAREPPYPDCVVVKCSGQREFWKEQGWRSWVPALSCPPSPLPNSSSTFWQVRHDSPTEQFQLWNKSEQFPAPEYDAITEKKNKKKKKRRKGLCPLPVSWEESSLSSSAPLTGETSHLQIPLGFWHLKSTARPRKSHTNQKQKRGGEGTSLCPTWLYRS